MAAGFADVLALTGVWFGGARRRDVDVAGAAHALGFLGDVKPKRRKRPRPARTFVDEDDVAIALTLLEEDE